MLLSKIKKSFGKDQIANGWELTYVDFFATDQLVELCKQTTTHHINSKTELETPNHI